MSSSATLFPPRLSSFEGQNWFHSQHSFGTLAHATGDSVAPNPSTRAHLVVQHVECLEHGRDKEVANPTFRKVLYMLSEVASRRILQQKVYSGVVFKSLRPYGCW